jgi:hypothetical protein
MLCQTDPSFFYLFFLYIRWVIILLRNNFFHKLVKFAKSGGLMMWVKTFLGLLLCVFLQSNVCGASEIEGDLGLLKKDQRAQLRREIDWISQTKSWILLSNRKDSLRTSLVTHDATYSDAQRPINVC